MKDRVPRLWNPTVSSIAVMNTTCLQREKQSLNIFVSPSPYFPIPQSPYRLLEGVSLAMRSTKGG